MRKVIVAAAAAVWTAFLLSPAEAQNQLEGRCRFERIKGRPEAGYQELYETNLFFSPAKSPPVGPSRRVGAMPGETTHDGRYHIGGLPPGKYSLLLSQPLFFLRQKVVPNVTVGQGGTKQLHVELAIEFSTYFRENNQWTGPGSAWYQVFKATGTSVGGVTFILAGKGCDAVDVAILEDTGSKDVRAWKPLGSRRRDRLSVGGDNWVRWRSGEIPLKPGKRYAVRLSGAGGDGKLQPYKRDKDDKSYKEGQAFDEGGRPQNFDINVLVFGDNDGTCVTMCKRTQGLGDLRDGHFAGKWGQTFVSKGKSLAAVDVWAAGANRKWDITFKWTVREGGPKGRQVGPVKATQAAYQAMGAGLHGVSYNPGEVALKEGKTYFVEFEAVDPPAESQGFNPYISDDAYDGGHGFQWNGSDWVPRQDEDVNMTVMEYAGEGAAPERRRPFLIKKRKKSDR